MLAIESNVALTLVYVGSSTVLSIRTEGLRKLEEQRLVYIVPS